jgi:hypothetical protein
VEVENVGVRSSEEMEVEDIDVFTRQQEVEEVESVGLRSSEEIEVEDIEVCYKAA